MTAHVTSKRLGLAVATASVLSLACSMSPVLADDTSRDGTGHLTFDCTEYNGSPGSPCTITSSNIPEIPVGTVVYHIQAANIVPNLLDTSVVYDAGDGNRATGHCLFDFVALSGLCQLTDGTGQLAGFEARFDMSSTAPPTFHADGPYLFKDIRHLRDS